MADWAVAAERAGWDGFFLWDHLLAFDPGPVDVVDPWMALAVAAVRTSRVRLGTLVTPLPRRRPAKVARETVTLDRLSGGRAVLGVGIGAMPFEWDYLREEPDAVVRGRMLDEQLELLERCGRAAPSITGARTTGSRAASPMRGGRGSSTPPRSGEREFPCGLPGPGRAPSRSAGQHGGTGSCRCGWTATGRCRTRGT
nr:LLM class flavin-dependent oxidoreductase [Terrabacter sp. MAHUQ-38]